MESTDIAKLQRIARVSQAFRPSAPIDQYAMLAGRQAQLMDVISAAGQPGQHVALYGERGVGKTSFANVLAEVFNQIGVGGYRGVGVNCSTDDNFDSIWRNIFRELDEDIEYVAITPEDVRHAIESFGSPALIVIDELDRLEDESSLSLLADTIKTFSDHSVNSTLVVVGVARSIDELIGEHESIERALVQVEMPRMSRGELREIIEKGCSYAELTALDLAIDKITKFSEGLPHYTHLLGLYAGQRAVMDDRTEIMVVDVDAAVDQAVAKHTIRSDYRRATRSTRTDTLYSQVLLACALAEKDALGFFPAGALRDPLEMITGKRYEIPAFAPHLKKFLEPGRGSVLRREGEPRSYFYRFANPLLQPYVILNGLSEKVISDETLASLEQRSTVHETSEPEPLF